MKKYSLVLSLVYFLSTYPSFAKQEINTSKIQEITGLSGKYDEKEAVFKITSPRTDVKISVDEWQMPPFMGLTSWASFTEGKKSDLMVMGDLVLFQDEVNPVMSVLFESGLEVTALHNHFFYDDPKVYFMHISGEGKLEKLSQGIKAAFEKVRVIRKENPTPMKSFQDMSIPTKNSITAQSLREVFKLDGEEKDGMFKITVGKKAKMECGCNIGKTMGVNTWAAFAGSDENAVVDGDFAVYEKELQPVLKSLRQSGINIVAIHHHMTGESPRVLFLHYWGRGKALGLAQSISKTLKLTK